MIKPIISKAFCIYTAKAGLFISMITVFQNALFVRFTAFYCRECTN